MVSFTLHCHDNVYDDLLTLFRFLSSETFFLQYAKVNKNTISDQLVIFPFKYHNGNPFGFFNFKIYSGKINNYMKLLCRNDIFFF